MSKSKLQSDIGRNSKVITAAVFLGLFAIGYIVLTYVFGDNTKTSQVSGIKTAGREIGTEESEHYNQILNQLNNQNADEAAQGKDTYISVLSTKSKEKEVEVAPLVTQPVQQPQQPAVYHQQPAPQSQTAKNNDDKLLREQMLALMNNWTAVPHSTARVSTDTVDYVASITTSAQSGQGSGTTQPTAQKIVSDYALAPAILEVDIDTDENSLVSAFIPGGEYAGARVFAMGYQRLTNTVDMTFTAMEWKGRSYKITAKAIDEVSMRSSLSGEVNNRWFSRIVLPAVAAGIGKTGQLYEQANSQNIITPQGGVIQTNPSTPNSSAVAGTIIGGMGQQAAKVLANDAANMPVKQVLINKDTTIGIRFIGPVLSTDDIAINASDVASRNEADLKRMAQPASQPPSNTSQIQYTETPLYQNQAVYPNPYRY